MLRKIVAILKAPWFFSLIGAIVLALLIWFVGPLVAIADVRPLESDLVRLLCVLVILVAWGLFNLFAVMRAKKSNAEFIKDVAEAPQDEGADAAAAGEEIAALRERLQGALDTLKRTKLGTSKGRQYLYELPWYILIGPPGSGKTTALVNSGLNFPLADESGGESLGGVGGTRRCDWWFTNEAVLLDTAGRYTTQDSQQDVDRAAWLGFLGLLKKHRPRQPINGVLIAISVADLATMGESERAAHARVLRQRIRELHDELGIRFPIYFLLTKADLLAGFVEFFEDMGREEREQVWGFTLEFSEKDDTDSLASLGERFEALVQRLSARLLERVHQEPDLTRRALIFGFPAQVASLKDVVADFIGEIFGGSRFEEHPLLRGIYLTSGTQEGTPIDRIVSALATDFGIERQRLAAFAGQGRSYFLTRLLREVVFPEASIVGVNRRQERRRRWIQRGAFGLAAVATLALAGLWYTSYSQNQGLLTKVEAGVAQYQTQVDSLDLSSVTNSDLAQILPALNTLRQMPAGYDEQDASVPLTMTLGLYQGDKLGSQSVATYRRALNLMFLPRVLLRLEEQIQGNMARADYLYEALKVYLMLGALGPMDDALVREWMRLEWESTYAGQENASGREALHLHLDALLAQPVTQIPLDGQLVGQARRALARMSLAERTYARIRQSQAARSLPDWRVSDHAGPAAARVFTRTSGRPLTEGVPGLYTYQGFHEVFLPVLGHAAEEAESESWVLGDADAPAAAQVDQLQREALALYQQDYAERWNALLTDLRITPFQSVAQGARLMNTLSGPSSPLRNILQAVVEETALTRPPEQGAAAGLAERAAEAGKEALMRRSTTASRLSQIIGPGGQAEAAPGAFVESRFRRLHEFVGDADGASAPMEHIIGMLNDVYVELTKAALALDQDQSIRDLTRGGAGRAAIRMLRSAAEDTPEPVRAWLTSAAQGSSTVTVKSAGDRIKDAWEEIREFCDGALHNRFPIFREAPSDVALEDFKSLFAPGGRLDTFFNTHLRPFVDTSGRPWRWRRVDNVDLGISDGDLEQFRRAAEIRKSFFPSGSSLRIRFDIRPIVLDKAATRVLLDIDGQTVSYRHGPTRPAQIEWPGPDGTGAVRLAFTLKAEGKTSSESKHGPWAWFHLLQKAKRRGTNQPDRFVAEFTLNDVSASFELRAQSVINPFNLDALHRFRCPASM